MMKATPIHQDAGRYARDVIINGMHLIAHATPRAHGVRNHHNSIGLTPTKPGTGDDDA